MPQHPHRPSSGNPAERTAAESAERGNKPSLLDMDVDSIFDPAFFDALGNPTRLKVFRILLESSTPLTVSQVQERSALDLKTVSRCLKDLKVAKLAECTPSGPYHLYVACVERFR